MCENLKFYANTVLEFFDEEGRVFAAFDLRELLSAQTKKALRERLSFPFAVLTAFNPEGVDGEHVENLKRAESLEAELRRRGAFFLRADGRSPDGAHREVGVAVSMSKEEAQSLARRFAQEAFFWVDEEGGWIVEGTRVFADVRLPATADELLR